MLIYIYIIYIYTYLDTHGISTDIYPVNLHDLFSDPFPEICSVNTSGIYSDSFADIHSEKTYRTYVLTSFDTKNLTVSVTCILIFF